MFPAEFVQDVTSRTMCSPVKSHPLVSELRTVEVSVLEHQGAVPLCMIISIDIHKKKKKKKN